MLTKNNKQAFSLLELIISIAVLTMVIGAIGAVMNQSLRIYAKSVYQTQAANQAHMVAEALYQDISGSYCIYRADSNSIDQYTTRYGTQGSYIRYRYNSATDVVSHLRCGTIEYPVSEGVTDFNLTYYTDRNASVNPAVNLGSVRAVKIDVVAQAQDKTFQLSTAAKLNYKPDRCYCAKTYGVTEGTTKKNDELFYIQQAPDNGLIFIGRSEGLFIGIRTDAAGFVGTTGTGGVSFGWASPAQEGFSVTSDGGYILGMHGSSFGGSEDFRMARIDSNYNELWRRTYGTDLDEFIEGVKQTADGGFILSGGFDILGANSDFLLVKTDRDGILSWSKRYGGTEREYLYSLRTTSDGGYIFGGQTYSFDAEVKDLLVVKTDNDGNITGGQCGSSARCWAKKYGGNDSDYISSIEKTYDGGYILLGHTVSFGVDFKDFWFSKIDLNGNIIWSKRYGYDAASGINKEFFSLSAIPTFDGGYIIGGYTKAFSTKSPVQYDYLLIKVDTNGDMEWAKAYEGSGLTSFGSFSWFGEPVCNLIQTSEGGYVLGWETRAYGDGNLDYYILKTDSSGNIGCCNMVTDVTSRIAQKDVTPEVADPEVIVNSVTMSTNTVTPSLIGITLNSSPVCLTH